jgi:hypothetical protein
MEGLFYRLGCSAGRWKSASSTQTYKKKPTRSGLVRGPRVSHGGQGREFQFFFFISSKKKSIHTNIHIHLILKLLLTNTNVKGFGK